MAKRKSSQKRNRKDADRRRSAPKKVTKPKAADPSETPAGPLTTPPEPERDKATGAIEFSQDVQEHSGPENANAERTVRSLQRFTNSNLPKGPWMDYAGRPDTPFACERRRACRISGLFVCVAANGTEEFCEDGYVIYDEPGRNPQPVPAAAFDDHFSAVPADPKN